MSQGNDLTNKERVVSVYRFYHLFHQVNTNITFVSLQANAFTQTLLRGADEALSSFVPLMFHFDPQQVFGSHGGMSGLPQPQLEEVPPPLPPIEISLTQPQPPSPMIPMAQPQLTIAQPHSTIVDFVRAADLKWCSYDEFLRIRQQEMGAPTAGFNVLQQSFTGAHSLALQEEPTNRHSSKRKSSNVPALPPPDEDIYEDKKQQPVTKNKFNGRDNFMSDQGTTQLQSAVADWPGYKLRNPGCTQQEYADFVGIHVETLFGHIRGTATAIEDRVQPGRPRVTDKKEINAFIQDTATKYSEEETLGKNKNVHHDNYITKLVMKWPAFANNQKIKSANGLSHFTSRHIRKPLQEEYAKRRKSSVEAADTSELKNVEEL